VASRRKVAKASMNLLANSTASPREGNEPRADAARPRKERQDWLQQTSHKTAAQTYSRK